MDTSSLIADALRRIGAALRKGRPPEPGAHDAAVEYLYVPCVRIRYHGFSAETRRWVQGVPIVKEDSQMDLLHQRQPTRLAERPAVLVEPDGDAQPGTILYFHGGSFSLGSPETAMVLTANLVRRTGVRASSLDYRLAPEHPFPAAIEDCVAAFRSLLDSGIDPPSIAFGGDSAGGGLTVTTCLAGRDAGLPMPAAIAAFSPGLDHTRSGVSMTTKEGIDPFFTMDGMGHTGQMYLGGQDPNQPLLAPAVLADLTGFPPILLQAGTNELLLDDSVRLAERAREADVDVILDITAGVPHVFQAFVGRLDESDQALDRAALFLTQHLSAH